MFCKVERSYIEDGFNLYGLRACVSNFSDCLDLILDRIGPDDSDDSHLTQSACTLYMLIHARYIITAHGLDAMYNKYAHKEFGTCPLIQCNGQPVLPVGLKDEIGTNTSKIFCPKCQCVYHPPPVRFRTFGSATVDGAAFGTTFAHLFLMTFNNLVPDGLSQESSYVPRVFGFRVHPTARQRSGNGTGNSPAIIPPGGGSGSRRNMSITAGSEAAAPLQPQGSGSAKPSAVAAAAAGGNDQNQGQSQSKGKKGKGRKSKMEESGGNSKRRTKNGGDESNSSQKSKRQKRP